MSMVRVSGTQTVKVKVNAIAMPDSYAGEYEVESGIGEQVLETAGKMMMKDLVISGIKTEERENATGKELQIGGTNG